MQNYCGTFLNSECAYYITKHHTMLLFRQYLRLLHTSFRIRKLSYALSLKQIDLDGKCISVFELIFFSFSDVMHDLEQSTARFFFFFFFFFFLVWWFYISNDSTPKLFFCDYSYLLNYLFVAIQFALSIFSMYHQSLAETVCFSNGKQMFYVLSSSII
jgi:hypothetical protein